MESKEKSLFYYLNHDHTYRPCDEIEWSTQFKELTKKDLRHLGRDIIYGFLISTLWIGTDDSFFRIGNP